MVIYFSGTGNSRAVAQLLAQLTESRPVAATEISSPLNIPSEDSNIIWVCPVHSWGIPPVVKRIIDQLTLCADNQPTHHLVLTCGDDCGYADRMWRECIEAKGWQTIGAYTVIMPNTYVSFPFFDVDSPEARDHKLAAMPARVKQIAREITGGHARVDLHRGSFAHFKTEVIYPSFVKHLISASKFGVSDSCIACGKCANVCPMGNISVAGGTPQWQTDCCGCLACYHICPRKAIDYGRFTKSKGQYFYSDVNAKGSNERTEGRR